MAEVLVAEIIMKYKVLTAGNCICRGRNRKLLIIYFRKAVAILIVK